MKKDVKRSKNKKGYCFIDYIELYGSNIIYYYGHPSVCVSTLKKSLRKVKKIVRNEIIDYMQRYIGSPDNTSDYYCNEFIIDGSQWILIHVGNNDPLTNTFQLGTLLHECLHAAIDIARSRGIKDDNNGYEALVYLAEFIFTNFLTHLKKQLYKRKKHGKNNKVRSTKESRVSQRN